LWITRPPNVQKPRGARQGSHPVEQIAIFKSPPRGGPLAVGNDHRIADLKDIASELAEVRAEPTIVEPTDAIVRTVASCVCGSDLWPYRGIDAVNEARPIGDEYCGIVEQVGEAVSVVKPGQFVIGGFTASDNTCPHRRAGMHISCEQCTGYDGCQSELIRIPLADGTLVATSEQPSDDLVPSLLALSDVMATGWHAAVSAGVGPDMTVAVVGQHVRKEDRSTSRVPPPKASPGSDDQGVVHA
jgi:Alcohol dehydrogenase GroES-like domain